MLRNLRRNIRKNRGFTLVELMIVVAIVGILAALAIYGVSRYMKSAKTAEARNSLGQLAKDAAAAYQREKMAGDVLGEGKATAVSNALCKSAVAPVPAKATEIDGKKYQSSPTEWTAGSADTGWQCLKFSMEQPQYYQYNYTLNADTLGFSATATGNLDGDKDYSTFTMNGALRDGTVATSPTAIENAPEE